MKPIPVKPTALKRILIVLALLLAPLAPVHAADTLLIENGQALAEIIVAEKPARMTKLAAKELQSYLEKISGAKVEVRTGSGKIIGKVSDATRSFGQHVSPSMG